MPKFAALVNSSTMGSAARALGAGAVGADDEEDAQAFKVAIPCGVFCGCACAVVRGGMCVPKMRRMRCEFSNSRTSGPNKEDTAAGGQNAVNRCAGGMCAWVWWVLARMRAVRSCVNTAV